MGSKRVQMNSPAIPADPAGAVPAAGEEFLRAPAGPHPVAPQREAAAVGVRLFVPVHYEPRYAYPLIVWLHSGGSDAGELTRIMPRLSLRNFAGAAPQADSVSSDGMRIWRQDAGGIARASREVVRAIEHARHKLNISEQRVFLAGQEQGGTMAIRVAFAVSERVAGVVSLNGGLPVGEVPPAGDRTRRIPVLWVQPEVEQATRESRLAEQDRVLRESGFDLQLHRSPSGEDIPASTWAAVNRWILERACGPKA